MTAECPGNFKADMPDTEPDVFCLSHPEVDVANVRAVRDQNTEMIIRNEPTRRVARNNSGKLQPDLVK